MTSEFSFHVFHKPALIQKHAPFSHMRFPPRHKDHPLLNPGPCTPAPPLLLPLLLHQGPRRFSALAATARYGQHHKDSVILCIAETLDRNHSWQPISVFSRFTERVGKWDKTERGSALWTIIKIIISINIYLVALKQNQHNGRRNGWGADPKR